MPLPKSALFFLGLVLMFLPFRAAAQLIEPPDKNRYQSPPFMASNPMLPQVLIVLGKDYKMFQHGYPGLVDLDGDGRVDTGFNPAVEYVGYFDSYSCYSYVGSTFKGLNGYFAYGDEAGYFKRAGAAVEDQSQEDINASRPSNLKKYVVSPRSISGVCDNFSETVKDGSFRTFSGNWLNYLTTSRMDAITKILYGGRRVIDTAGAQARTVLNSSFVPPDATSWGGETRSDDTWMAVTPLSAYYDIRKYTPYDKPQNGKAHFFARSSDMGATNKQFPSLKVLLNADKSSFNLSNGATDSVSAPISVTGPNGRYWDWVLVNRPLPDDKVLANDNVRRSILVYNLKVEVCQKGFISKTEGCLKYPGDKPSPDDDVYKPGGLLQRYGEGVSPMNFGLLTGGFNQNIRLRGGKLRNQVGSTLGSPPFSSDSYLPAVNRKTGQIVPQGLIANIDNLRISGWSPLRNPTCGWECQRYYNVYSWRNPLGEMLYEGVRYLSGALTPTNSFANEPDKDEDGSSINSLTGFSANSNSWKSKRPTNFLYSCIKPVILLIGDVSTDYDGDQMGSDLNFPLLADTKLPSGFTEGANLPKVFNFNVYLDTITKLEGLGGNSSVQYSYSSGPNDSC
ncbi:MAG: hypothetical protein LBV23_00615, partial [Deltaproteobacteria bacterium]|nr:hypothetical protein [Deltaproteobacteria bacterium]